MHKSGRLLWLEEFPELPIFNDLIALKNLVAILFNHNAETKWNDRVQNFISGQEPDMISTKIEFEQQV